MARTPPWKRPLRPCPLLWERAPPPGRPARWCQGDPISNPGLFAGFLNLTQPLSLSEPQFPQIPPPKASVTLNTLPPRKLAFSPNPSQRERNGQRVGLQPGQVCVRLVCVGLMSAKRLAEDQAAHGASVRSLHRKAAGRLGSAKGRRTVSCEEPPGPGAGEPSEAHIRLFVSVSLDTSFFFLCNPVRQQNMAPTPAPESLSHAWGALRHLRAASSP